MKKTFRPIPAALASLAFLLSAGCTRLGTNFPVNRTDGVRTGMSKQEVQKIMGKPNIMSSVIVDGEKLETWTWSYSSVAGVIFYKGRANSFTIAFGKNGTVVDAPRSLAVTSGWGVFVSHNVVVTAPHPVAK